MGVQKLVCPTCGGSGVGSASIKGGTCAAGQCPDCRMTGEVTIDRWEKLTGETYPPELRTPAATGKVPAPPRDNADMALWPRIQQAIDAATVSRADVLVNLPSCHRKNCQGSHGDVDLVFRMFAKAISDSIHTELLCKAISEPDDDPEVVV